MRVISITAQLKTIVVMIATKDQYYQIITTGKFYFNPKAYFLSGAATIEQEGTLTYKAISFKYVS